MQEMTDTKGLVVMTQCSSREERRLGPPYVVARIERSTSWLRSASCFRLWCDAYMQRGRQHRLNPCHEQSVQHSDCPSVEGRTPGEVQSGECYRRPPPAAVFCHLSEELESKRVSEAALACVRNWLVLFTVGDAMSRHLPLRTCRCQLDRRRRRSCGR